MASTRTAPLRARPPEPSFDVHPLGTLEAEPTPTSRRVPAEPVARNAIRSSVPGSLQSLDWRQAAGGALVVLGMLGIIIAWFGVSGTLDPGEQMPYISSGGFG
ncbi:MAG: hypothetical protein ACLGIZ_17935, partial [Acidimicrobiia bacterium]